MAKDLISAIEEVGRKCGSHVKYEIADQLAVYQGAVIHPVGSPSAEEVALCYTVGTLQFTHLKGNPKVRIGGLNMDRFNLDGEWNGQYLVNWKPDPAQAA